MTPSRCAPLGQSERSVRRAIGGARAALAQYVYVGWLAERVRETCAAAAGGSGRTCRAGATRPPPSAWPGDGLEPVCLRPGRLSQGHGSHTGGVGRGGRGAEGGAALDAGGARGGFVQAAGLLQFGLALGPAGLGRAVPVSDCLYVMWPRGRRWPRYRVTVFWFLLAFFPPLGLLSSTEAFLCLTGFICFYL